jgi:hypothetical protein
LKSLLLQAFADFYGQEESLYKKLLLASQFSPVFVFTLSDVSIATTSKSSVNVQVSYGDQETEIRELHSPASIQQSSNSTFSLWWCCQTKPHKVHNLNESSHSKRIDENDPHECVDRTFPSYTKSADLSAVPARRKCVLLSSFQPFSLFDDILLNRLKTYLENFMDSLVMNYLDLICFSTEENPMFRCEILPPQLIKVESDNSAEVEAKGNRRFFGVVLYDDYGVVMERHCGFINLPYNFLIEYLEWVKFCHLLKLLPRKDP